MYSLLIIHDQIMPKREDNSSLEARQWLPLTVHCESYCQKVTSVYVVCVTAEGYPLIAVLGIFKLFVDNKSNFSLIFQSKNKHGKLIFACKYDRLALKVIH
jgi:hypothetical protein